MMLPRVLESKLEQEGEKESKKVKEEEYLFSILPRMHFTLHGKRLLRFVGVHIYLDLARIPLSILLRTSKV